MENDTNYRIVFFSFWFFPVFEVLNSEGLMLLTSTLADRSLILVTNRDYDLLLSREQNPEWSVATKLIIVLQLAK